VIPHTITHALELGRRVWAARQQGSSPVAAVAGHFGSRYQFHGVIKALREEEHLGFYFTTVTLEGRDRRAELVIQERKQCSTANRAKSSVCSRIWS